MILFVNSCIRKESRTLDLANELLKKLGGKYEEVNLLKEDIKPLDTQSLELRNEIIESGNYDHPMCKYAKQFAAADTIVRAAPYWDLNFPAVLKTYLEQVYVTGIVSRYNEKGIPEGLCKANKLYVVTTAGGPFLPEYSYNYVKDLTTKAFGVKETKLVVAEMLDIQGMDVDKIMREAKANIEI